MGTEVVLTADEKRAIADLKALSKRWPKSLSLVVDHDISVVRCLPDGNRAMDSLGGLDRDYIVADGIKIKATGACW